MLILKQNAANSVPTPPAGKGTIFLDDSDVLSVKTSDGNVENFPTVAASNAQVVFINGTALSGEAAFTYDFNNNVLNISGNVAAGNVKTDNLLYANGTPWDLSDPGGSNTEIQFNDDESFGGSAAFVFNKSSNLVTVAANLNANNLNATTHITSGNVWANSGTIGAQTLKGEAGNLSNITAGNITGQVANSLVAGTVYTAAQPNITSVGTLTSVAVTGNVIAGNVYSNSGTIGASLLTGTLTTAAQPNITSVGTLTDLNVSGNSVIGGNLTVNGNLVYVNVETIAVEDPIIQLQTGPNGAAPSSNSGKDVGSALNYYDSQARVAFMGWDVSNAEFGLASQASITNEVVTFSQYGNLRVNVIYANGAGLTNIPGGNITGNISGNISNADYATAAGTAGTVTTAAQPNITSVGTLSSLAVTANITGGNVYANSGIIGAQNLKGEGGNISNIQGANVSGTVATATTAGTVTTAAQPNITSVGTLTGLGVNGNITAANITANTGVFTGNGSGLSALAGANVTGQVANAAVAGTVYTAAQPNITSVGTLSSLAVTGNVTAGNVKTDNLLYANGNPWDLSDPGGSNTQIQFNDDESFGGSAAFTFNKTSNLVSVTANLNANNLNATEFVTAGNVYANSGTVGASLLTGTLTTTAQPNITSVGTLTSLTVTGNVSAGNVSGTLLTGTLTTAAQPNITSVGSLTSLTVTGNMTAGNISGANLITANFVGGTLTTNAQTNITSVGTLGSLAVTGNATAGNVYANSGTVGASLLTGTLTTAAQPNITSVGTLTSLTVSGNISGGNITGGALANGNSNVNIPAAAGNVNISVNGTANVAVVTATGVNVAGTLNATGNANVGNLGTGGLIVATGNVTGGNLVTSGALSVTGNANVGNLGTGGLISATGNVSGGNITTTGQLVSSVSTGTAPLVVSSTTKVANLNADLLDGYSTDTAATANTVVIRDTNGSFSANIVTANLTGRASTANVANTVNDAAQPNITSVGTLTSVSVTGNANVGNLGTGGLIVATGNVTGGNLVTGGVLSVTGNANVGNLGTAGLIVATGNITGGNLMGPHANGNSNVNIPAAAGNVNISVNGTANVLVVTATGANIAGTLNATGNANVGNLGTAQVLASANVTAPQLISNVATGTAPLVVTSTTVVANLRAATSNVANTVNDAAQPNITSVGTLTSVAVTGNGTFGNVYANSGTVGASLLTGTLTTAAQPNVTSLGTLTSVAVTGNVTAGNVYANSGTIGASLLTGTLTTAAQPNVTSVGTLSSLTVTANVAAGNLTTTGVLSVTGTGVSSIAGNLDMTSNNIINLAAPVNANDAATKQYVDDVAQGLHTHDTCNAATENTLAILSGGTVTYNNGSSGVGATLTTTGSYTTIDGVTLSNGMRILVKNEANSAHNGIYDRTSSTVLTRSSDFDTPTEMAGGDFTFVTAGTLYDNTGWVMTDPVTTVGTSPVTWVQFSGAGTYTAGTGLTLTGSQFSITNTAVSAASYGNGDRVASFTVNSQGQLTAASNVVIAANAANLTGTTLNSGIVTSSLTTVGTLGSLAVTGTTTSGNFATAGNITASFLVSNVATGTAPFTVTSTTRVANLNVAYANVADNINVTTQTSGNAYLIFANALTGNVSETANAAFVANTSNGALYATTFIGAVSGNGAALTDLNASNISTGTLAQARLANSTLTLGNTTLTLGATTTTVAGLTNITSTQLTSNVATGTAPLVVTSTTRVANLNVATSGVANTVNDAAQPNITSTGTLSSLTVSGNIVAQANVTVSGYTIGSVNAAVSAAGTVQGNATALTKDINVVSTVASGAGVVLPTAIAGMRVTIMNTAANALAVYPASGGKINSAATDASFSQAAGARLDFVATSATQWYTLNATYA